MAHPPPIVVLVVAVTELEQPLVTIDEKVEQLIVEVPESDGGQETKKSVTVTTEQLDVLLDVDSVIDVVGFSDSVASDIDVACWSSDSVISIGSEFPKSPNPGGI